jgi:hypothetical protein
MNKQFLLIAILLCGSLLSMAGDVQSLVVQTKSGSESAHPLSGVQRITFSGTSMNVVKKDATQTDYTTANVQKLLFGLRSTTDLAPAPLSESSLSVYPNPATNLLFVKGVKAASSVVVYNISGVAQTVSSNYLNDGLQLNVSALPQGLYILQVNNQTVKFQKQ